MRKSLATQLTLKFDDDNVFEASKSQSPQPGTTSRATTLRQSAFDSATYAASSRRAGRINAASVSDDEVSNLLRERRELISKQFDGTITKVEVHRLQLIRWSLDRIEDARHGQHLEMLENAVVAYENFRGDIDRLLVEIGNVKSGKR